MSLKEITNYLLKTPGGNRLLIGKAFIVFTLVFYFVSYKYISHVSFGALNQINYVDTLENNALKLSFKDTHNTKMLFLENQYKAAGQLKNACKEIAMLYFKNYYSFTVCFALFSTLLSVSLFLVAHKGWQHADATLKAFVVLSSVFASFFYFVPKALNNEDNMYKNIQKQRNYQGIQLNILTFVNAGDSSRIDSMISDVDKDIRYNYGFMVTIDASQIGNPLTQLNSSLGSTESNPQPAPDGQQHSRNMQAEDKPQKRKTK